jgi:hypothetical protein
VKGLVAFDSKSGSGALYHSAYPNLLSVSRSNFTSLNGTWGSSHSAVAISQTAGSVRANLTLFEGCLDGDAVFYKTGGVAAFGECQFRSCAPAVTHWSGASDRIQDVLEFCFFADTDLKPYMFQGGSILLLNCLFAGQIPTAYWAAISTTGSQRLYATTQFEFDEGSLLETCRGIAWLPPRLARTALIHPSEALATVAPKSVALAPTKPLVATNRPLSATEGFTGTSDEPFDASDAASESDVEHSEPPPASPTPTPTPSASPAPTLTGSAAESAEATVPDSEPGSTAEPPAGGWGASGWRLWVTILGALAVAGLTCFFIWLFCRRQKSSSDEKGAETNLAPTDPMLEMLDTIPDSQVNPLEEETGCDVCLSDHSSGRDVPYVEATTKGHSGQGRTGDELARGSKESAGPRSGADADVLDGQVDAPDPHGVVFLPTFTEPDPHGLEPEEAAPKKRPGGVRGKLAVGGSNAVQGIGKGSIRETFLRSLPGGGLVVVDTETTVSDTAAAGSPSDGVMKVDGEIASQLAGIAHRSEAAPVATPTPAPLKPAAAPVKPTAAAKLPPVPTKPTAPLKPAAAVPPKPAATPAKPLAGKPMKTSIDVE